MSNNDRPISYAGMAAVDELDALLTHGDFEPSVEVDTIALDAIPDAIAEARRLLEALEGLQANLTSGGSADEAAGHKYDVRLTTEALAAFAALVGA